ncbi:MAG: site-specific integrase [Planctomycetota bacterium]
MREIRLWCSWVESKRKFVMRYRDEQGRTRQAGTCKSTRRRDAERETAEREAELNSPESTKSKRYDITLTEIHERYKTARLKHRSADYAYQLQAGLKRMRAVAVDRGIEDISARHIDTEFLAATIELLCDEVELATAKSYRTSLRAFFRWAAGLELVRDINWSVTAVEGIVKSGGRPITDDEFKTLIKTVPKFVGKDRAAEFQNLLRCCFLSGMRLSEALQFSATRKDCHHVDIGYGASPRIRFVAKQKNRRDQTVVMLPEFEKFIKSVRPHDDGFYFRPLNKHGKPYPSAKAVGRTIADIGRKSGIVVKTDEDGEPKKFVSAHDTRRACAYRLVSRGYKVFTVQHLMRHADPKTTQQFYSGDMADMVAGEIWGSPEERDIESDIHLRIA